MSSFVYDHALSSKIIGSAWPQKMHRRHAQVANDGSGGIRDVQPVTTLFASSVSTTLFVGTAHYGINSREGCNSFLRRAGEPSP